MDDRPWLIRVLNPGVPWYVAVPCNVLAGAAIVLAAVDPHAYAWPAFGLAAIAGGLLYGTAALMRWRR